MLEETTRKLARFNQTRLLPGAVHAFDKVQEEVMYVEHIRGMVSLPTCAVDYGFYEDLIHNGPGQGDSLFPWLAEHATEEQMKWFLLQEAAGEAGFGDLVAMTQVKMPLKAKLEMARNYWDEMGNGKEPNVHDKLLRAVVLYYGLEPEVGKTLNEPLMLNNLMTAFAVHRRYAWLSLGALGVIEMTAPTRVVYVDRGLQRLGAPKKIREYFTLHGVLDIKHSRGWNEQVIEPLATTEHMKEIAEGAYLRLWCGERCFNRYREYFGI